MYPKAVNMVTNNFFCGARAQLGPRLPHHWGY